MMKNIIIKYVGKRNFLSVLFLGSIFLSLSPCLEAQVPSFPVSQVEGSAGVRLPGKTWQTIQSGDTVPFGSEIITAVSGLKLNFRQSRVRIFPFSHLFLKLEKDQLLITVVSGKVAFSDKNQQLTKPTIILVKGPTETSITSTKFEPIFPFDSTSIDQTYRTLSPWNNPQASGSGP